MPAVQPAHTALPEPPPALVAVAQDGSVVPVAEDARARWAASVAFIVEPPRAATIERTVGTLVCTDGQRYRGTLNTGGETPQWECAWAEPRALQREGVRAIILAGDGTPAAPATNDTAAPANQSSVPTDDIVMSTDGTHLAGVVVALMNDGVRIEHGVAGARTIATVPWERVRSVLFTGHTEPPPETLVWLTDGSIIGGAASRWESAEVLQIDAAPKRPRVRAPRSAILGAAMQPARVSPLAALVPATADASDGAGLRYMLTPPITHGGQWALGAAPIEVEGPVKLTYPPLAAPATLTMCVSLDPQVRDTGVVEVIVRAAGRELHRGRLDAEHSAHEVLVALPAGPFDIELLSADGSAVGDVVHFERALLLSHTPT